MNDSGARRTPVMAPSRFVASDCTTSLLAKVGRNFEPTKSAKSMTSRTGAELPVFITMSKRSPRAGSVTARAAPRTSREASSSSVRLAKRATHGRRRPGSKKRFSGTPVAKAAGVRNHPRAPTPTRCEARRRLPVPCSAIMGPESRSIGVQPGMPAEMSEAHGLVRARATAKAPRLKNASGRRPSQRNGVYACVPARSIAMKITASGQCTSVAATRRQERYRVSDAQNTLAAAKHTRYAPVKRYCCTARGVTCVAS